MAIAAPDIFSYHDYREFLRDWIGHLKSTKAGFSLRHLAKESQIGVSYLSMVLSGKRNLSTKALEKFLHMLALSNSEKSYLELLRRLSDAESLDVRVGALRKLQKFEKYRAQNRNELEAYRYLTRWYYVAIREMACLKDFKDDPAWIHERLGGRVSLGEAREALEFLLANGYLIRNETGRIAPPQKHIECVGGVYKVILAKFHDEMLALARRAVESTPPEHRQVIGHTVAIEEKDFEKVREILEETIIKIAALGKQHTHGEEIYHVELAAFPLTSPK